eukprot:TRINITY_DN8337_c0_g1_i1.p1 TRINITY_DN8337_c0_g1~~TRINITY_DN8337_c0_g1_i1.p1  ORF type:complete len:566 (-),score=115.80 TRINITY_DN8337_c0_g1_i1:77-1774(-)
MSGLFQLFKPGRVDTRSSRTRTQSSRITLPPSSVLVGLLLLCGTRAAHFDLVVYGSTPAGIAAAVTAGHLGMSVGLFEPLPMIGGMGAAGNLALNDGGTHAEHTGLARNFSLLNGQHYGLDTEVPHPESFVAEASFNALLKAANVTSVNLDCRLLSAAAATSGGSSTVQSITVHCMDEPVTGTVFIDASYDGEVMVAVGNIPYTAGREAISEYNESLAGARAPGWSGVSGPQHVNALHDDGSIIKYVANLSELPSAGEADDALMAFQHRMCISGEDNRVPWPKPDGYDPVDFTLLQRAIDAEGGKSNVFSGMPPSRLPGLPANIKKYCLCCGITVASTDQPLLNKGWANASWERKQEIIAEHTYFELGSFYYLSNDPHVNQSVRDLFSQYGLCGDEFEQYNHIPPQLYVRISNRMVGDFVMTQNNIAAPRTKPDSIGVGDWSFDEHMTGKYAVPVGAGRYEVQLEGNFWPAVANGSNWYDVPFKIMLPKRGTGGNLLVPVCLSASAVAYSSTRIENMFMNVGSAAGVAAKQLVDGEVAVVQDVNVSKVQAILAQTFKQRIHGPPQ